MKHPEAKASLVPLTEMICSEHTNVEVAHSLSKWFYNVKKVLNKLLSLHMWKLILAAPCYTLFVTALIQNTCWQRVINKEGISNNGIKTVVHICSAHIMNSHKIERKSTKKPSK